MRVKKIISAFIALGILVSMIPAAISVNAEDAQELTKTVYVNVAQNKPIKGGQWSDQDPLTNLVDGSRMTYIVPEGSYTDNDGGVVSTEADFWFTVDLQHIYKLDKIELYDRYYSPSDGGRHHFKIYGSNNADFSDAEELGGMEDSNDEQFPAKGAFTLQLNGAKAYRYVKVQRTGAGYFGYSEFKVYANETVTEVSRNKTATASHESVGGGVTWVASKAVDGKNADGNDCWLVRDGEHKYPYLQIDLEQPMPIGYIELEGRAGGTDYEPNRQQIGIYGSDTAIEGIPADGTNNWTVNGTKLTGVKGRGDYVEFPFPAVPGKFVSATDESTSYQYLIYKKEAAIQTAVGEFRAFVVNPTIISAEATQDLSVKVLFSDEMDAATLENISVSDYLGSPVSITDLSVSGNEVIFTLPAAGEYRISAGNDVKNTKGVGAANATASISIADDEAPDIYEGLTSSVVLCNVAQNKPITGGQWSDQYPITNLVDGSRKSFVVPEGTHTNNSSGTVSTTDKFWFTVDLQHIYKIEKIELYDRYDVPAEGGRQHFKIYGSNNADFSDAEELGGMGDRDDTVFPEKGAFTIQLDGLKAYRYIKLQRDGGYYHGYSEFKVYANETVTEVSRNKPATASHESVAVGGAITWDASRAVDGKNSNSDDGWVVRDTEFRYPYLQIDLGHAYPIGYIELEGRAGNTDNPPNRQQIGIYGSNTAIEGTPANGTDNWTVNGTKLTGVKGTGDYVDFPFPAVPGKFASSIDDSQPYRYLIYKKEDNTQTALGEFRAFVVNPTVISAETEGSTVNILFSDEMSSSSLNNGITVTDASNTPYEVTNISVNGHMLRFNIENSPSYGQLTLQIDKAKNIKGVPMAEAYDMKINIGAGAGLDVTSFGFDKNAVQAGETITATANLANYMSDTMPIVLFVTVKDAGGKTYTMQMDKKSIETGASSVLTAEVTVPTGIEGAIVNAYLWNNIDKTPCHDKIELK